MDSNGGNENYNEEEYVEQGQSSSFGQFSAGMGSAFNNSRTIAVFLIPISS